MKQTKKHLSRRLMLRYLVKLVIYPAICVAAILLLALLGVQIGTSITWQRTDFWYPLALTVANHYDFLGMLACVLGAVGVFVFQVWRLSRDISSLVGVIEDVARHSAEEFSLPHAMRDAELLLRQVQLESLQNDERAREAEQRKNDLVVYLAHDLKTPLTSVLGYLTLLRDEQEITPELQHKYLSVATAKAQRLEDLINEFFEITRFNLKGLVLETTRLNLSRMLEQVNDEFRPLYGEKNLTVHTEIQPGLELEADAGKLERVVDNLLRNAVNYSWPGSEVSLRAETVNIPETGPCIRVTVENQGDTIPEHKLARIFEQFYRLDSARSAEGGSGLGLAIAKEIVELHGGGIAAHSADNLIRFTMLLPIKEAP